MLAKSLCLSLVLFVCGCADAPVQLSLRLAEAQEDVYTYSYRQHIIKEDETSKVDIDQTLTFVWREVVKEVSPESTNVGLTFETTKYKVVMTKDGESMWAEQFSSDDPEATPSTSVKGYAGLVGRGFGMRLGPLGEPVEVTGCEELISAIKAELYNSSNPAEVTAGNQFASQISSQAWTDLFRPIKDIYPADPVRVGDSWTRTFKITSGFPHVQNTRFELVERKDGQCRIKLTSDVEPRAGSPVSDFASATARTELSGTQTGEFTLDEATGRILRGRIESDLLGKITVLAEEAENDQSMPMKFTGILEVKLEP